MRSIVSSTPSATSRPLQSRRWFSLAGAIAAAVLFGAFLIGLIARLQSSLAVSDNWLITLFNLNLRPGSTQPSALSVVSGLDIGLMLLFGTVMAAMYPALRHANRTWAVIAVALPFLGVPIFIATGTAGRSAVLLAGFISSILALRGQFGSTTSGWTGVLASAILLFLGDFGTAAFAPSRLLAVFIGIGYVLWTLWLLTVAFELFRRRQHAAA